MSLNLPAARKCIIHISWRQLHSAFHRQCIVKQKQWSWCHTCVAMWLSHEPIAAGCAEQERPRATPRVSKVIYFMRDDGWPTTYWDLFPITKRGAKWNGRTLLLWWCCCSVSAMRETDWESNWNVSAVMACSYWKSDAHHTPVSQVWRSVTTEHCVPHTSHWM